MYLERIKKAQEVLNSENIDLMIICDRENLIYFTGISEIECGGLVIPSKGEPVLITLWLDIPFIKNKLEYDCIGYVYRKETLAQKIVEHVNSLGFLNPKILFSKYFIEVGVYKTLVKGIKNMTVIDGGSLLYKIRAIKDDLEISMIEHASKIVVEGMKKAVEVLRPGMTEAHVLGEAELAMRKAGSEGHPFRMQVLNESRQMMVHPIATDTTIEDNQLVVIHLGASYKGYVSKMCRTVILGKAEEGKIKLLKSLIKAQELAIKNIKSGSLSNEAYMACYESLKKDGLEKYLIDDIGYGIGIRQSEFYPIIGKNRSDLLEKNMVVDLMFPTIYHPKYGGGRIADVVQIGDSAKILTPLEKYFEKN